MEPQIKCHSRSGLHLSLSLAVVDDQKARSAQGALDVHLQLMIKSNNGFASHQPQAVRMPTSWTDVTARSRTVKKTWLFGIALSLGLSNLPVVTYAQYAATPYGANSLAPSGYAIGDAYAQPAAAPAVNPYAQSVPYGQPSGLTPPPQYAHPQYAQPQPLSLQSEYGPASTYGQSSIPAHMAAYPQEPVPAPPAFETEQAPQQGWVGPNNGQYQPTQPPQPPQAGNGYAHGNMDQNYAQALAPTAMNPGYAGGCSTGNCGGPVYNGSMVGGPVYADGVRGRAHHWFSSHSAVPGKAWFVGGGALLFRRVDDRNQALTYDTNMPTENPLGTRDARQARLPGFEVFAGRYFNCGRNALMLNYWGLYPEDQSATITNGGGTYRSRYHFNGIDMPSQNVYDWYDGANSHRLVRSSNYHNVEANLLGFAVGGAARNWGGCGDCGDCGSCGSGCAAFTGPCNLTPNMCGSRLNWTWLGGFRWFRFTDNLQYAASENDDMFDGSADDLYYDNNVRNDLVGFQLGSAGTYCLGKRLNLYALSKAGIYNNHSELYTRIGRNGAMPTTATIVSGNIYNGQDYQVTASQNNAAFLGELGTGVGVRITKGWSANVGYRVIGASGVATAVNTIPVEMLHLGNVSNYNTTSSLILHGVTVGGMYNF